MLAAVRATTRVCMRSISSLTNSGYQQANVVVLPRSLADDFDTFCKRNSAPLPLLYRSQPGETSCPPLCRDADIRTDISQYCVFEKGQMVKTVSSLQSYITQTKSPSEQSAVQDGPGTDMVSFYLGCSFGFESRLKKAGVPVRNLEQGKNISMYRTTVPCVQAGVFSCPLVVTMRPVPTDKLDAAVEVTHLNPLAHGAPIHIGDPALLGIQDLCKPDYGEAVEQQPGDVPVFWACGVTAIEAIRSNKPSLAFSHSPGCMFLTDIPDTTSSSPITPPSDSMDPSSIILNPELTPLSFLVSDNPLFYSLASRRTVEKIRQLETIIGEDPGERGIRALFIQDELLRSCLALSHSSSVAITTGFPTHYMHNPPDETDGPPGAIAMANMLLSMGKQVTLVTDRRAVEMNQAIIDEAVREGVLTDTIPLVTFENNSPDSALKFLCHNGDINKPRYDHLVAIERSGRATDGNYYNMREINIKHLVDPIDDLFIAAKDIPGIITTGIGDGGNELGMGKVKDRVKSLMPKGDVIACDVPADFAITAGVSNWGGYAVACGLYLLLTCPSHQRYLKKGLGLNRAVPQDQLQKWRAGLPSVDKEESILSTLVRFGIRSGKTGHLAMEVDGLTFHPTHSGIITRLLEATLD
ncbi:D-glutamate cyclase, mitochondrial [Sphaeramia orbicularis]|uniref:D-glutamate cyclase-like C-terminal domain-containing protein n=1 Tax=Sphaeramia orbicularis TaxID=375764 RepID=A0A673CTE1_9TELE|nr:D-glutamate cyclase, mitochondrial [Sphaeramia orbicularis]